MTAVYKRMICKCNQYILILLSKYRGNHVNLISEDRKSQPFLSLVGIYTQNCCILTSLNVPFFRSSIFKYRIVESGDEE